MKKLSRRMIFAYVAAFVIMLVFCAHTHEASAGVEFLGRLKGTWAGEGRAFGNDANLQLKWDWVLGGRFLELNLRNEIQAHSGQKQIFEGHAYYKATGERSCEGTWFDSQGASYQIKGSFEGDALTVLWGPSGQEHGKSVYRFLESGKLEVTDSVKQKDGTWKQFGNFIVKRQ